MGLFKPAWQRKYNSAGGYTNQKYHMIRIRIQRSIDKVKSDQKLMEIATTAPDSRAYEYALQKMTDQAMLADLAKNGARSEVRCEAIRNLTDQSVLEEIALNDTDISARRCAVKRLDRNSGVLEEIALNDKDSSVRVCAIERLDDNSGVLEHIAKNDSDSYAREQAIMRLIGQSDIRTAIGTLTDLSILDSLVENPVSADIRHLAIKRRYALDGNRTTSVEERKILGLCLLCGGERKIETFPGWDGKEHKSECTRCGDVKKWHTSYVTGK
jgi:hypothetical protein